MKTDKIRKTFLDFFADKGHEIVPSSSLIPADPTALLTSAGMQQFVPYLSGKIEPPYRRAASAQKCFRTSDIDEVGDQYHHTYFEMLGNWSFGDYFKTEAIQWALELLVKEYKLPQDKLWTTVFKGEKGIPKDIESIETWQEAGIDTKKIKAFGMEDNFWGPVGSGGPCGPCTEIHYDRSKDFQKEKCSLNGCGPNCSCGRFVEVWNLVFMEYNKTREGTYEKLPAQNVDTGAGLERLAAVLQNKSSDYETDLFLPIVNTIKELSQISEKQEDSEKAVRIIADHMRAVCFLIADGVIPSNEDRGYMLRRLMRRAMRYARRLHMGKNFLIPICQVVIDVYKGQYPELQKKQNDILILVQSEEEKFMKSLRDGLKRFRVLVTETKNQDKTVLDPQKTFQLYDTYGFPIELTIEMAQEKGLKVDEKGFEKEFERHRKVSRAGAVHKFSGVGEWGDRVAPQHSATHLLHQALRDVLGEHAHQDGSDLTPERLRFDFTHPKPLTKREIKAIEDLVNKQIKRDLLVTVEKKKFENAIKAGALAFFREKYPKEVTVYTMGDFSKEVCTGPHVKHTNQIGKFKIVKDEALSSGVHRIRAVLTGSTYVPKGITVFDSKL
ncbi:alanine--tRNA ligase [Patescibacteria group bacterium AH-259-L07]|nr:alanine--tRNA ligase [Patescibacteria group bacterium AH-259-L07]